MAASTAAFAAAEAAVAAATGDDLPAAASTGPPSVPPSSSESTSNQDSGSHVVLSDTGARTDGEDVKSTCGRARPANLHDEHDGLARLRTWALVIQRAGWSPSGSPRAQFGCTMGGKPIADRETLVRHFQHTN